MSRNLSEARSGISQQVNALAALRKSDLRLEQERIDRGYARQALGEAVSGVTGQTV